MPKICNTSDKNKLRLTALRAVFLIFLLCLASALLLGLGACNKNPEDNSGNGNSGGNGPVTDVPPDEADPDPDGGEEDEGDKDNPLLKGDVVNVNNYKTTTQVGYKAEILGTVEANRPVEGLHDEHEKFGIPAYPVYGRTLNAVIGAGKEEARNALIAESAYLASSSTSHNSGRSDSPYYKMDGDGYLYLADGTPSLKENNEHRQLYKHTASEGMYLGDVSDSEPRIVKRLTYRKRSYSSYYNVTGLYAPAGEVIKVEMTKKDFDATKGIVIHIGQALYNAQANNIWTAKNQMQRMPVILNTMVIDSNSAVYDEERDVYTAYVGSFLGGPIYIRDESATFSVTISGGVTYSHFILGVTTKAEFEENRKSTAPYFDLEVWDSGVLHSGPKTYAKSFEYEDIYKAAVLWDKISLVSSRVRNQGVVFLYDPFVAAGAAVAFPGRRSVNCPLGWMSSSLNYNSFVNSGAWGNMHEYNHNFQGFGCGSDGEVTNNSLNLVEYSLFTKVSASRQLASYGGAGLSGWNAYTSATWALNRVLTGQITGTNGLAVYSTLMHNFGQDAFIKSACASGVNYFRKWGENVHYNMSYYIGLVKAFAAGSQGYVDTIAEEQKDYPMFVPVSSVYQTGRSYNYNGQKIYSKTQQPFVIPYGEPYTVDLSAYKVNSANQYESGSVVLPEGFSYKIKNIRTDETNGTFVKTGDYVYTFTPGDKEESGAIYVTLGITKDDGAFEVADVDLVLGFRQSRETNKNMLERTTYTFEEGKAYTNAREAFENNYSGFIRANRTDNVNPVQNSNTDIWYGGDSPAPANAVVEVSGKLFVTETGRYRIALRGRYSCALFLSTDNGKTYELGAEITPAHGNSSNFHLDDETTYADIDLERDNWLYFKEVMISQPTGKASFIGLGVSQFTTPTFTSTVTIDENGNEVTHYFDSTGKEVTEEEMNNAEPIPPKGVSYATAYRNSYEFSKQFTSDYYYKRGYNYNYTSRPEILTEQGVPKLVEELSNFKPWANDEQQFGAANLFDGDPSTGMHTHNSFYTSADTPAILTFDNGSEITANTLTLFGGKGFPKSFTLEGSIDGENFFPMGTWTNSNLNPSVGTSKDFAFSACTFRYFRLRITATHSGSSRLSFNELLFSHVLSVKGNGSNLYSPDSEIFEYRGNWSVQSEFSVFGHNYKGGTDATVRFNFTGTRLGILTTDGHANKYEVYIDGTLVTPIEAEQKHGGYSLTYLSPLLNDGKHEVIIRCVEDFAFDSLAIW